MGIVLLLVLLDHAGCFGYRGDDAALFDRRGVRIVSVIEADALTIRTTDTGRETVVQLLGADAPRGAAGAEARNYTASRLTGKTLTLRLDPLQRRDAAG